MRPLLFVMNPRRIPECIEAIEDLDVDRCWLTGMTEAHLAPYLNEVVAETSYDVYLIVSDDCVPTQDALDAVLALLEQGWPVATGYCNLDEGEYAHVVNLTKSPLVGFPPNERSYDSFTLAEVAAARMPQVRSWFAGFALTGMSRELWQRYPFKVLHEASGGSCSDYSLSWRLQEDDVPIMAPKAGFVRHVKERWNVADSRPEKRLLIGEVDPVVRLEVLS